MNNLLRTRGIQMLAKPYFRAALSVACLLLFATPCVHASLLVPEGARLQLAGGTFSLAGTDIIIEGQLDASDGALLSVQDLLIADSGMLSLGAGRIELWGDWNNTGTFSAGQGLVRFSDGAQPVGSSILGDNRFHALDIRSASGKRYRLQTGGTQSVDASLTLLGTGTPLQIDTTSGPIASLWLAPSGAQDIANVGVSDVHATGQLLAPEQQNQGGSGNDIGWFGNGGGAPLPAPTPNIVPTGSAGAHLLLALLMIAAGGLAVARRRA